jgi:hypothetical protein
MANPPIIQVGAWWIVRGRHDDGFLRLDALNYTAAQALAESERLLPTIKDEEVRAMAQMLEASQEESAAARAALAAIAAEQTTTTGGQDDGE